jgi:hypothetical protein
MTFLNPLVLFGLAAAGIPILLHLLNLRKLRTVEFSTLSFLKELQQTKIRRLKLRQLLLLLLRTLLIVAIVVAFARPVLKGTMLGQIGAHAHSSVVFILDDSFSMLGVDEHGERFKQAKDAAAELVTLLKDGDEAFLIKLSDLPKATVDPATHDFAALANVLKEAKVTRIRRPLDEAFRVAAKLLAESKNANKEVYLVSDMQRTLLPENPAATPAAAGLFPEGTQFFVIPVGATPVANASIDTVAIGTTIIEKEKPVSLSCTIRNYSASPLRDYVVSVFLDGVRAAQRNVSAEGWGSAEAEFSVTPKRTGHIAGYVELEQDGIEDDNRRYFTLYVPEVISVAMIGATPAETQYPALALRAGAGEGGGSLLSIVQTTPQKFSLLNLTDVDIIISTTWDEYGPADIDRIKAFLERGGGLILFPGVNATAASAPLLAALKLPPITGVLGGSAEATGLFFQNVDTDHPIFSSMFEPGRSRGKTPPAPESPRILKSLQFQPGKEGHAVITLSGNSAFLAEQKFGPGTILMFSVSPSLAWSDLPLKGLFAPLIHRAVMYASAHEESNPTFLTGEEPLLVVPRRHAGSESAAETPHDRLLSLVSPDSVEEVLQQTSHVTTDGAVTVKATTLAQPGIYTVEAAKSAITIFAVNPDRRESDTRQASAADLGAFWTSLGIPEAAVRTAPPSAGLPAVITQSRFGTELWQYLVGLAILLALIEMLVARDSRKETTA